MIRVAIVDDHPMTRRGMQAILGDHEDIAVTLSVATPKDLHAACAGGWPDVILLDLYLADGLPCIATIGELRERARVLVVSASALTRDVVAAIRAGANGYVTKLADPELLVSSTRTVASGGFALSAELADILHSRLTPDPPTQQPEQVPLSPREEQALDLIAHGFTQSQVATRMGVSAATVNTYVERIRAKLQVGNKAELTRAAIDRARAREAE
jgi:DNA-binding NarL/FixJ family response regulator